MDSDDDALAAELELLDAMYGDAAPFRSGVRCSGGVAPAMGGMPFSEEDVKQVVIGARHIAILLTDGRVCRMSFTLNPSAVLEQVERAQTKAAPGLGARGRLGGAARKGVSFSAGGAPQTQQQQQKVPGARSGP